MAIDFPASPSNGQTFTAGSTTWTWDGTKWSITSGGGGGGGTGSSIVQGDTSASVVDTGSDGRFVVTTEGSERLRVDKSGRLLVGTSSALSGSVNGNFNSSNALLQVVGNSSGTPRGATFALGRSQPASAINVDDFIGGLIFSDNASAEFAHIFCYADAAAGTGDHPSRLVFSTTADGASTPTERMRVDNQGFVGIGVTPAVNLHVVQSTSENSGPAIVFNKNYSGDSGSGVLHLGKYDNNSTTSQIFQRFYVNVANTGSGMITANGASQATFTSFSDARLKQNIQDLPNQLDAICALRPVEFDYKDGSGHQIGFIAQEVEQVYPDLIGKADDEMLTLSGLGKHEARLIKAIQELKDELDAAKQRIAVLEGGTN